LFVQLPQWFRSVFRLAQSPLQSVSPDGHWQVPLLQILPPLQTIPHPPQFELEVESDTHAPLQSVVPPLQDFTHAPAAQT